MKVFFHELMAIMPRSKKPGDTPLTAPVRTPPPPAAVEEEEEEEEVPASVQLGKTQRAGMGPAAPASTRRDQQQHGGHQNERQGVGREGGGVQSTSSQIIGIFVSGGGGRERQSASPAAPLFCSRKKFHVLG